MYSDWVMIFLAAVGFLWLGVLTFLVWQTREFLSDLFASSGERDFRKRFSEVVTGFGNSNLRMDSINKRMDELERKGLENIQRVELLRYNPYDDTGGDQSFSLALLDDTGDGFVVTSLHSRSTTRVFAKPVVKGKSEKYNFSKEESDVVEKALKR
jgi:hypothetical protein